MSDEQTDLVGVPHCCFMGCGRDAEFDLWGSSGHFEDYTQSCVEHVGALLGTPTWLATNNTQWIVVPVGAEAP